MAINFPSTTGQPTDGSFTHVVGNITYRWNGVSWTASVFSGGSLDDLTNVDALTNIGNGKVLKYNSGSELWEVADDGGGGIELTDLSVTVNSAGTAGLTYDNTTGVFSYTPPDLSSYLTSYTETQTLDNVLALGAVTNRDITTTGKILYSNVYNTSGDLPSASTYHGMFAHVHADAHGYFAHAGAWTQLLDTGSSLSELTDVSTTAPSANDVLTWDGSNWGPSASQGGSASSSLVAPATFDITVTDGYDGTYSSYYTISGNDRYGEIGGNDVPVRMYTGDTVVFDTSALSGSHPLHIRVSDGGASVSNPAATGEGTSSISWTPSATGTYYYQCSSHPGMLGIIYVEDPVNAEPTIDVKNTNIEGEWDYGSDSEQLNWGIGSSIPGHNNAQNNLPQYMPAYSDSAGNLPPISNPPDHPDPVSVAFDARYDTWLNVASSVDNGIIELTFTNPVMVDNLYELTIGYDGNVQPGYNGGNYVTTTTTTNDIQEITLKASGSGTGLQLDKLSFKTVTASGATGRLYYVIASWGGSTGMMVYKSSKVGIGGAGRKFHRHDSSVNLQLGAEHLNSIIGVNTLIPRSMVLPIHYMCREGDTITILDVGTGKLDRNDDNTFPQAFSPGYPTYDYNPGNARNCPISIFPSLEQGIQQAGPGPWNAGVNGSSVYWLPTTNTTGKYWSEEFHGMPFVVNRNGQSITLVFCGPLYGWRVLP
tara:strand:- start:1610 stop:3730 length:2121 start_codon:yes stop_codon:yes gene_type:complete